MTRLAKGPIHVFRDDSAHRRHRRGSDGSRHRTSGGICGHRGAIVGRVARAGDERPRHDRGRARAPRRKREDLGACDLVVEAVTEHVETKLQLFKPARRAVKPGAILASNTSSISITRIAAATKRPDRGAGHALLQPRAGDEARRGDPRAADLRRHLRRREGRGAKLNKTAVTAKDSPGFLVNRILIPLLNEACSRSRGPRHRRGHRPGREARAQPPDGSARARGFIGLDTVLAIADVLHREFGDDKYRAPVLLRTTSPLAGSAQGRPRLLPLRREVNRLREANVRRQARGQARPRAPSRR
jgi:hypothetical protein